MENCQLSAKVTLDFKKTGVWRIMRETSLPRERRCGRQNASGQNMHVLFKRLPVAPNIFPLGYSHIPARNCPSPPVNRAMPTTMFGLFMWRIFVLYNDRSNSVDAAEKSPLRYMLVTVGDGQMNVQATRASNLCRFLRWSLRVERVFPASGKMCDWKYLSFIVMKRR